MRLKCRDVSVQVYMFDGAIVKVPLDGYEQFAAVVDDVAQDNGISFKFTRFAP